MIYGSIKNIRDQKILTGRLKQGLDYLLGLTAKNIIKQPEGYFEKVAIRGNDVFVMHQVYQTKPRSQAKFEAHRSYIDLQFLWKGREIISVSDIKGLSVLERYNRKKDVGFFAYEKTMDLIMGPGHLAVFFPDDAHAPCLSLGRRELVYKSVVKVKV